MNVPTSYHNHNLTLEDRRILSGAYGKPVRVPVYGLFCDCEEPHFYTWGKPGSDVTATYSDTCPRTRAFARAYGGKVRDDLLALILNHRVRGSTAASTGGAG